MEIRLVHVLVTDRAIDQRAAGILVSHVSTASYKKEHKKEGDGSLAGVQKEETSEIRIKVPIK